MKQDVSGGNVSVGHCTMQCLSNQYFRFRTERTTGERFYVSNYCYPPQLHLIANPTAVMLRIARVAMLRLTNLGKPGAKRWCTAMVLVAVCALTIYVATRYDRCMQASDQHHTVVTHPESWTPGLQRLLNNAATWVPPLVCAAIFEDTGYQRHVPQPAARVSSLLLETDLYYRPPPASLF